VAPPSAASQKQLKKAITAGGFALLFASVAVFLTMQLVDSGSGATTGQLTAVLKKQAEAYETKYKKLETDFKTLQASSKTEKTPGNGLVNGFNLFPERKIVPAAGYRAITLPMDISALVAGFIQPGTRVDVLMTVPEADSGHRSKLLMQHIKVLATVPEKLAAVASANGKAMVTVEVSPKQAALLVLAQEAGKLYLIKRADADAQVVKITDARMVVTAASAGSGTMAGGFLASRNGFNPQGNPMAMGGGFTPGMMSANEGLPANASSASGNALPPPPAEKPKPTFTMEILKGSASENKTFEWEGARR
jgi:Flp pilus assembly protein CpaB